MKRSPTPSLIVLPIVTNDGVFMAHYSENGLAELNFPGRKRSIASQLGNDAQIPANIRAWHRITESALRKALAGHAPGRLPPLDWSGTTAFQQSVWRAMLQIACGETRSYGQLARNIGKPAAVRAVGGACGANPIPVLVPCHRVLAANGKIGGFSSGLDWKHRLLNREGIVL